MPHRFHQRPNRSVSLTYQYFCTIFYYYPKKSPPAVSFHLYDEFKEMSLRHFCAVCRIPYEGELEEHHREDVGDFVKLLLWKSQRRALRQKSLAYTFLFYATLPYLLVDA